jgi:hypothetical protein
MTCTIKATLNKAPEALNCVHMVDTNSVFPFAVIDNAVRISELLNVIVGCELIGMDGVFCGTGNVIPDDRHYSPRLNVCSDRSADLSFFPMNKAYNRSFALCASPRRAGVLTADVSLIHFNVSVHFAMFFIHQLTNHGEHTPCRLISDTNFTLKLFGTYPAACAGHQEHGVKPIPERRGGLVEYRSGQRAYLITAELAGINGLALYPVMRSYLLALYAVYAVRIAAIEDTLKASIVSRIFLIELFNRVLCGFHFSLPNSISNRSITQNVRDVKGYLPKLFC